MTSARRRQRNTSHDSLIYVAFFASGLAALIYEISWSRQIGLLFGHTAQAAAVVVSGFFAGMGIGYALAAVWVRRVNPLIGYAIAEWLAACWACLIPVLLRLLEHPAAAAPSSTEFATPVARGNLFWPAPARHDRPGRDPALYCRVSLTATPAGR